MKRSEVPVVSAQLAVPKPKLIVWLCALVMLALGNIASLAGDRALVDVIGYSNDLRYFAFEEYGIQDGSGFAYSTIYFVDLIEDRWVLGTPIEKVAYDETERLSDIRTASREAAASHINELDINLPAQTIAMNGDGMLDIDGQTLSFGLPMMQAENGIVGKHALSIETFKALGGVPCMDWFDKEPLGYALSIKDSDGNREIHRDESLPRSRNCPAAYKIFAVFLPFQATDIAKAVVLMSVYTYGFEGMDRRFIAEPLTGKP